MCPSFERYARRAYIPPPPFNCFPSGQEAERERVLLAELAEERKKRQKAEEKAALMARRAAEHIEKIEAARAGSVARDAEVLQRQREARRRRVYENRVKVKNEFDAAWEVKLRETVEREMELAKEWLESDPEAPFKVQKEMKILKRKFYAAPLPETVELERALRDPANYIFAHMANLLYKENKTLQMFFNQFDKEVGSRCNRHGIGAGGRGGRQSRSLCRYCVGYGAKCLVAKRRQG